VYFWRLRLRLVDRRLKKLESVIKKAEDIMEEMSGPLEEEEFSRAVGKSHWCDVSVELRKHNEAGDAMSKAVKEKDYLLAKKAYILGF
jgi:hypothetical protein